MRLLVSPVVPDYQFVAEQLKRFGLDARIKAKPEISDNGEAKTVAERYEWGSITFTYASDTEGSTVIFVDESGKVTSPPMCLGAVAEIDDPDGIECHGNPRAQTGSKDFRPCSFRKVCQMAKDLAETVGMSVHEVLLVCSFEEIEAGEALVLLAEHSVEKAQLEPRLCRVPKPKTKVPKKLSTSEAEAELLKRAQEFFTKIGEAVGKKVLSGDSAAERAAVPFTNLYVRNRMASSHYLGLYAYVSAGWDNPVCVMRPVPRSLAFHVMVPVTEEELDKLDLERSCAGYNKDGRTSGGRLKTRIHGVAVEDLEHMVPLMGRLVAKHLFEAPK